MKKLIILPVLLCLAVPTLAQQKSDAKIIKTTSSTVTNGSTVTSGCTDYSILTSVTNKIDCATAIGSAGQVLTSNGAGSKPSFQAASGGGITVGTTTITSGTSTRIPFNDSGIYGEDSAFTWDKTLNRILLDPTGNENHPSYSFIGDNTTGMGQYGGVPGILGFYSSDALQFTCYASYCTFGAVIRSGSDGGNPIGTSGSRFSYGMFKNWVSAAVQVLPKTSSYPTVSDDQAARFTNTGAGGAVTFTLPASAGNGWNARFCRITNQSVIIAPSGTDLIAYGGSVTTVTTGTVTIGTNNCCVIVEDLSAGLWQASSGTGTCTLTFS